MTSQLTPEIAHLRACGTLAFLSVYLACAAAWAEESSATGADGVSRCEPALDVRFVESAPRDRFEFVNRSDDATQVSDATIELAGSVGRLVFDTLDGGAGVEVFQPFRIDEGAELLIASTPPEDGGERITLTFEAFESGERFVFSIDVDDRLASSELGQIRVAGSEIAGALLSVSLTDADGVRRSVSATFDDDARASIAGNSCAE